LREPVVWRAFAFEVLETVRREVLPLFDAGWSLQVRTMIEEAVECETAFAEDVVSGGTCDTC
jgi:ribonucleoside-diphosphate reductase beta chain